MTIDTSTLPREARSALYSLASRLTLVEADPELLDALRRPEILDVFEVLEPGTRTYIVDTTWDGDALDELAADYADLFILPGGVAPFAASWTDGDPAMARATLKDRIEEVMDALGIRTTDFGMGNVPSDHVGMLLALAAVAAERDGGLEARTLDLLQPWGVAFGEQMAREAKNPLYRATGRLIRELLDSAN